MIIDKKKGEFTGYWYFYIYSKLKERSTNNELNLVDAKSLLFEWRVPKNLRIVIIKELELMELLTIINRDTVKLNNFSIDMDNISKIYEQVGILSLEN
jgi:hypothetical protein